MSSPIPSVAVNYPYGVRNSSYAAGFHTGEDRACPVGTVVQATWDAVVYFAGWGSGCWGSPYGYQVVLESTYQGIVVRHGYNHLSHIGVHAGLHVHEGDHIALSGDTGNTTGAHLHYEERTSPFGYDDHCRAPVLSHIAMPRADKEPAAAHGTVYVDKLHQGQQGSDSVAALRYRLQNHTQMPSSHAPGLGSDYDKQVMEAVRYWQRNIMGKVGGPEVKDGTHLTNPQANLLFGDNYRVVESWKT